MAGKGSPLKSPRFFLGLMGTDLNSGRIGALGVLLIALFYAHPGYPGPWNDGAFTDGLLGIFGLGCLYIAWFRYKFRRNGLVPRVNEIRNPLHSIKYTLSCATLICIFSIIYGGSNILPGSSGLVLFLISLLMYVQAAYVFLSLGPLSD